MCIHRQRTVVDRWTANRPSSRRRNRRSGRPRFHGHRSKSTYLYVEKIICAPFCRTESHVENNF
jgi:hypothetical protein